MATAALTSLFRCFFDAAFTFFIQSIKKEIPQSSNKINEPTYKCSGLYITQYKSVILYIFITVLLYRRSDLMITFSFKEYNIKGFSV